MESYLTGRKQCTRIGDSTSSFVGCPVDVPQGSILGPLLFSLYVNDLQLVCPEVDIQMYADDTVILAHGKNRCEVAAKLTVAMANISDWLSEFCLTLNISKTACMYFYNRKNGSQTDIIVNGERIHTVSHFKYLGITVDWQLSFKKHVTQVCNTVKFNLRNLRYISRNQLL